MANLANLQFQFFKVKSLSDNRLREKAQTNFQTNLSANRTPNPSARFISFVFEDASTRNSLSLAAARELLEITRLAEGEGYRGLIFQSTGRVFCSGGNLKDYAKNEDPNAGIVVNQEITELLNQFSSCALATVALVEGDCFGGGLELISAFDEIVALPEVMFGFWQRRIGLSFGWGGGHRLARRLGDQTLVHLALQARGIFAPEARELKLVDHLVGAAKAQEFALARLERLTQFSMHPMAPLKRWRRQISAESESAVFEGLWWNADHQAALAPFR